MRFSNFLLLAGVILLPWLLIPKVLFGQRLQDTTKVHSLQEVAVTDQKIDSRLLLQRIITEKRLRFRDTEIAYMLIQENLSSHKFDTLSDLLILDFKDQQLSDAYSISCLKNYHKPNHAWVIVLWRIFNSFIFIKQSSADWELFKTNCKVALTSDGTKKEFVQWGIKKNADTVQATYQFNNSGSSKICHYFHRGKLQLYTFGTIIYLSDSTSVLPYEISIFRPPYSDCRLHLRRIALDLKKQERTPIGILKPLILVLEH